MAQRRIDFSPEETYRVQSTGTEQPVTLDAVFSYSGT
jgi:hypothetical protein